MSTQVDLVKAVSDLSSAITTLEQKVDSTPTIVDQITLDQTVAALQDFRSRVDIEAAKK